MVNKRKKKKEIDQQILQEIFRLKKERMELNSIIDKSIEASEVIMNDLSVLEAKYFYLLREARYRKIRVMQ